MLDFTANAFDCGGDDVAPVGDGRRAEHDDKFGTGIELLIDRARERRLLVRYAILGGDARPGRRDTGGRDLQGLFDHLGRQARQEC